MKQEDFDALTEISRQLFAANQMALTALINALARQGTLVRSDFMKELKLMRDNTESFGEYSDIIIDGLLSGSDSASSQSQLSREQLRALLSVVDGGKPPPTDK